MIGHLVYHKPDMMTFEQIQRLLSNLAECQAQFQASLEQRDSRPDQAANARLQRLENPEENSES